MSNFYLKLDGIAGSSLKNCGDQALAIANKLEISVVWSHNGIECWVYPYGSTEQLEASWEYAVNHGKKYANNVGRSW